MNKVWEIIANSALIIALLSLITCLCKWTIKGYLQIGILELVFASSLFLYIICPTSFREVLWDAILDIIDYLF